VRKCSINLRNLNGSFLCCDATSQAVVWEHSAIWPAVLHRSFSSIPSEPRAPPQQQSGQIQSTKERQCWASASLLPTAYPVRYARDMWRTTKGKGVVVSNNGRNQAECELESWEKQHLSGDLEEPTTSTPVMSRIRGWIHPVHAEVGEEATLELQDGQILRFFYNNSGSTEITAKGGFEAGMNLGNFVEGNYRHLVLRVRQKEDCLQISAYDPKSAHRDHPLFEDYSNDLEDAKKTAVILARGYLNDTSTPFALPVWKKRQ
jgi:hypothetical protein